MTKKAILRNSAASIILWSAGTHAFAQAPAAAPEIEVEQIVVTGSRIVRDGYEAPTPTTVLGVEELQRKAPVNIADQINQLPALAGSTRNITNNVSGGTIGVNSLNLRNLGATRTLVLLDGQRLPAATTAATIDVNVIPNSLVKRVDIVTGGASAAWGSDAVAGVVNFVLDKDFKGIKGDIQAGITTYGDDPTVRGSLAAGTRFADDRGHVMASVEYAYDDGIRRMPRKWYTGLKQVFNPAYTATNGQPQIIVRDNVGYSTLAPGSIVISGPLRGTYFGQGGTPLQLNYGSITSDPYTVGGDWQANDFSLLTEDMLPQSTRFNVFGRTSYAVTDNVEVFAQYSYNRAKVLTNGSPEYRTGGITIQRDNAFLPQAVRDRMLAANVTSLTLGSWNEALRDVSVNNTRELARYTIGGNGNFAAVGKDWSWDAFYNRNTSNIFQSANSSANAAYFRAIDAVVVTAANVGTSGLALGSTVCRSSLTAPTNGCAPLNILGIGVASQAGVDYVKDLSFLKQKIVQDEIAGTVRGEPLSTWAGPVSVAFGFEYRKETASGINDPTSQVNGYFQGNYKPLRGSFNVKEIFGETVIPLAKDAPFAQSLDLNAAFRATDYSTSGRVDTWKLGLVWAPVEDIKLRFTKSRDIRAGNLANLFQPGRTTSITITDPQLASISYLSLTNEIGNTTIDPEIGKSLNIGVVLAPRFIPGLTGAIDYFDIRVSDAIGSLGAQAMIDLCAAGGDVCNFVNRGADGRISRIDLLPINLARQSVRGTDFELGYVLPLEDISDSLVGRFSLRALATHYTKAVTDTGLVNNVPQVTLGNVGGTPRWRYRVEATYSTDQLMMSLTGRGVSDGLLSALNVECQSSCPASTTQNRTIDNNHVDGALYFDAAFNYKFKPGLEAFFVVENLANKDPAPVASNTSIPGAQWGVSGTYYDLFGRSFRGGVRFRY
jgi:outer membrane receptor protein involved in Fe transport